MFAKRLKELRKGKKISQIRLAEMLGVSQATITFWETGKRDPDVSMLMKIADIFGVSTDYLLGRVPMEIKVIKENAPPPSEDEYEIVIEPGDPVPSADDLERRIAEIVQRELQKKGL